MIIETREKMAVELDGELSDLPADHYVCQAICDFLSGKMKKIKACEKQGET